MNGIEVMMRRVADVNAKFKREVLTSDQLALACAEAMSNAVGFCHASGTVVCAGQIDEKRHFAGGQSAVAAFAVRDDKMVFDLAISSKTGTPAGAWPQYGKWAGVIRSDAQKDYMTGFIRRFREASELCMEIHEAFEFVRDQFHWTQETMTKSVNVNYDERQLPRTLRGSTLRQAASMVEEQLEKMDIRGQYLMRPRQQRQSRGEHARLKVLRTVGASVRIMVRPGDNSTCWEYDLVCPGTVDAALMEERLKVALSQKQDEEEEPTPVAQETPKTAPIAALPAPTAPIAALPAPTAPKPALTAEAPHLAYGATNGAAPGADVLRMMVDAIDRRAARQKQLEALGAERIALTAQLAAIQTKIEAVEARQMELLQQDEGDAQAKAAADLFQRMSAMFAK